MALGPRMEMRQGQSLVMTPQLQQAIKLLQFSNVELAEYIEAELEKNPMLERVEEEFAPSENENNSDTANNSELAINSDAPDPHAENALDASFEDLYNDADIPAAHAVGSVTDWSKAGEGRHYDDLEGIENSISNEISLHDHLEAQASLAFSNPQDRICAAYLIDFVDEAGYLRADMVESQNNLGISAEKIEEIVQILQTFDPVGICARNVEECLAAQLKEKDRYDPAMQKLVANLELLAKRDLKTLMHICEIDGEDLAQMIGEIRALTPKPGAAFGTSYGSAIVPDVYVKEAPNGMWVVELNSDTLPRVLVNNAYCETVSRAARSDEEKSYITECHNDASWLIKSLDQRARTILKVAKEIVRRQDGFLTYGVSHLRPLVLKDIAKVIEMHESTVSRVTSNKYIGTPRGIFELKYFFTTALSSSYGEDTHSSEAVRHQIKTLIDDEPIQTPLSDDAIVEILKETGIDIARRTVAKYREAMRIPSSVQRRRSASGF
ncbi:MAG: RNA polymerase factor sigma-54 [Caulobacterales bacterium]|nr:RNA polymerase factor sigma-54 [Caulobacterales bacterium]